MPIPTWPCLFLKRSSGTCSAISPLENAGVAGGEGKGILGGMKILVCSWNYPPVVGGIEVVAEQVAEGLHGLGHEVTVLAAALPAGAAEADGTVEVARAAKKGIPRFLLHAVREGGRRGFRGSSSTRCAKEGGGSGRSGRTGSSARA